MNLNGANKRKKGQQLATIDKQIYRHKIFDFPTIQEGYIQWDPDPDERNFKYRDYDEIKILASETWVYELIELKASAVVTYKKEVTQSTQQNFSLGFIFTSTSIIRVNDSSIRPGAGRVTGWGTTIISFDPPLQRWDYLEIIK